jgi:hypothetical protein
LYDPDRELHGDDEQYNEQHDEF